MAEQPPPAFAWLILATSVVAVSSAGAVFQLINEVDPILRASWRLQATALILLPPFIYQFLNLKNNDVETFSRLRERRVILAILGSSICLWIHFGSWVWSLDHTSLTHSLLFVTAHPLVIVSGLYLLGKKISPGQTTGALLGFLGAGIILLGVTNEGEVTLIGDLAAFIGAIAVVGYLVAGRVLRAWMPLFIYAFPVTLIAALLLGLSSIVIEGTSLGGLPAVSSLFGWSDILWLPAIAYLAIGPGLIGHTGINGVLRWFTPLVISVAVLFEPLIGSLIGWYLGTTTVPGVYTWLGGIFLIFGVIMVTLGQTSIDELTNGIDEGE
ncbi:MAG: DMT family transporter [Candidatus Poseidoniales archaeon]|nr:DMT family transporter [Candidatus Poseidoniales archaeon]